MGQRQLRAALLASQAMGLLVFHPVQEALRFRAPGSLAIHREMHPSPALMAFRATMLIPMLEMLVLGTRLRLPLVMIRPKTAILVPVKGLTATQTIPPFSCQMGSPVLPGQVRVRRLLLSPPRSVMGRLRRPAALVMPMRTALMAMHLTPSQSSEPMDSQPL